MPKPSLDAERESAAAVDYRARTERAESGISRAESDESFEALLRGVAAAPAAPPAVILPMPGEVISGKYRIEEKLGQGGMGAVFRATHLISQKQVAIKWMLRSASNDQARSRFVREAQAAARIDHPNVVDVYDVGQDGERGMFLVMQFLRGESLGDRIARGTLSVLETVDLLVPAMRGVAAVHEAGVIHRDLKPDNIFVCTRRPGEAAESKVLDFGISAFESRDGVDHTLTSEGMILGTPAYMSPEQIQNSRGVDVRADVYAFGAILYQALTGKLPFAADSHNGLVVAIVQGNLKEPRALRSDLPSEVSKIVMRALAKNRDDRYPTVEALIQALAPHGSMRESAAPPPKRSPAKLVAFVAAALLAAVLAYVIVAVRSEAPPVVKTAPVAQKPVVQAPVVEAPVEVAPAVQAEAPPAVEPSAELAKVRKPVVKTKPQPTTAAPVAPAVPKAAAGRSGKIAIEDL